MDSSSRSPSPLPFSRFSSNRSDTTEPTSIDDGAESDCSGHSQRRPDEGLKRRATYGNVPDKTVTIEELRACNVPSKAWVAIRGKVYDVSLFRDKHPGGREILHYAAGKDITPLFEVNHGGRQLQLLQKFYVGRLVGKDHPGFPIPDAFSVTVKSRVNAYFKANGIDYKNHIGGYINIGTTFVSIIAVFILQWTPIVLSNMWLFAGVAMFYAFVIHHWAVCAIHDGSHAAISHNRTFWKLLTASHDFVNGMSGTLWTYQHVLSHHSYTNIDHFDVDIATRETDFRRIKSSQIYEKAYQYQAFYSAFLYLLLAMSIRIDDFRSAFGTSHRKAALQVNPLTTEQRFFFFAGKAFFVLHRCILPLFFTDIKHMLLAFLITDLTQSITYALVAQASHVVTDVSFPKPSPETGDMETDWMRLQVEASQDYSHGGKFMTWWTGGLNYQVVHHLFPQVCQQYYEEITPIVKAATAEFGVKYEIKNGFWEAVGGHVGLLRLLGTPPHDD